MEPWYQRTYRWSQTNLTEDDPIRCDIEFWKEYWTQMGVQGVIINCGGIVSYYQSQNPFSYKARFLNGEDYFGKFYKAARDQGLTVIARMDINCTTQDFYEKYPDWFAVDQEGNPIKTQGRYVACVNSGYYKEFIPSVFQEVIEKYHPDGFSDNSWTGLGKKEICYCPKCQESFQKAYNISLPQKPSWEDPAYGNWIRWSYRCRIDNWKLFNETTKKYGGSDCLWFGMINADPFQTGSRFFDIKKIASLAPFLFCDHQYRDHHNGFEQNALNGDLLKLAATEDIIVAESMAHYYKGMRTFRLSANPKQETNHWMLSGIAGGISPWMHFVGGGQQDRRKFQTSKHVYGWHQKYEKYLARRENMANIGIVWTQENIDFYGREEGLERTTYPWIGFTKALSRHGIPFVPIHGDDIETYQDRIDTLILPDVAILTPDQQRAICSYLDQGKNLIFTSKSGLLNEDGEQAAERILWDRLGLDDQAKTLGAMRNGEDNWLHHETHSYIRLPNERHESLEGFAETDILPFGGVIQLVESKGPLQPICSYIPAFPIYPPEFSWIREERPDVAPIYAGTLETGSRVIYLAGDLDRCYGKYRIPDQGHLLAQTVIWAANQTIPIAVETYGHIHCSLYRQDQGMILHLVNLTGGDGPVGSCEECLPVGPVKVKLKHLSKIKEEGLLTVGNKIVTLVSTDEGYEFTVDQIQDHEMVLLSLEEE